MLEISLARVQYVNFSNNTQLKIYSPSALLKILPRYMYYTYNQQTATVFYIRVLENILSRLILIFIILFR